MYYIRVEKLLPPNGYFKNVLGSFVVLVCARIISLLSIRGVFDRIMHSATVLYASFVIIAHTNSTYSILSPLINGQFNPWQRLGVLQMCMLPNLCIPDSAFVF